MAKFKIGDTIVAKNGAPYGCTTDGWIGKVVGTLENPNGYEFHQGDIKVADMDGFCKFSVESKYFNLMDESQKIVITSDGVKITTAKLYEGKRVIKTAVAKCHPYDDFDFMIGANVAFNRLFTNNLWKRFEVGEIDVEVTRDNVMKFLKLCEERNLKWRNGDKATFYHPFCDTNNKYVFITNKYDRQYGLGFYHHKHERDVVNFAEFFIDQNVAERDEPKFTKADLKNGMFVIMSDGNIGVIINNTIVYESGGFDKFDQMSDDMCFYYRYIAGVVTGVSFGDAKQTFEKNLGGLIYRRK